MKRNEIIFACVLTFVALVVLFTSGKLSSTDTIYVRNIVAKTSDGKDVALDLVLGKSSRDCEYYDSQIGYYRTDFDVISRIDSTGVYSDVLESKILSRLDFQYPKCFVEIEVKNLRMERM